MLDCGFGVLTNLRRADIPLEKIDRVFITHTHSDHIGDFTGLIWAMGLEGRKKRLEVIASRETFSVLSRVMKLQSTPPEILRFELRYIQPDDSGAEFCTTIHTPTNLAYRLKLDGRVITYTGDTAPSREVVALARGSDILVHDSTYLAEKEDLGAITKHSSARQAAIAAREAGARKLVLTHVFPGHSDADYEREAGGIKGIDFVVGRDLLTIKV